MHEAQGKSGSARKVEAKNQKLESELADLEREMDLMRVRFERVAESERRLSCQLAGKCEMDAQLKKSIQMNNFLNEKINEKDDFIEQKQSRFRDELRQMSELIERKDQER